MKKLLLLALVLFSVMPSHAQLITNPFGFYAYEKEDLAQNNITTIYEYYVTQEEDEAYGKGYMPDDSLYSKRFGVHSTGWLIEVLENSTEYGEREPIGAMYYTYASPRGKVSQMEFEGYDSDSYKVVYTYNPQGVLLTKNILTFDPTEERFEVKKGLIVASKLYTTYAIYDDEGNFEKGVAAYSGRAEFYYDKTGRLIEYKRYSQNLADESDEALILIVRNQFTLEGRLHMSEQFNYFDGQEDLSLRTTYTYDSSNLLKQVFVENVLFEQIYYLRYVYK